MNSESFNKLLLEEKAGLIERQGEYIANRAIYNKSTIDLYKVKDFYVEKFLDVKTEELQQIVVTTLEEILHNYIDLRELYLTNKQILPPQK